MSKISSFSWIWVVHCLILPKNHSYILLTQFLSALFNAEVCLLVRASIGRYPPFFPDFIQYSVSCTQVFFWRIPTDCRRTKGAFCKNPKGAFSADNCGSRPPGVLWVYGASFMAKKRVFEIRVVRSESIFCVSGKILGTYFLSIWTEFTTYPNSNPLMKILKSAWRFTASLRCSRQKTVARSNTPLRILRCTRNPCSTPG